MRQASYESRTNGMKDWRSRGLIISLTVVGLVAVPILAGLLLCCCKRRKQRATRGVDEEEGGRDSQKKLNSSGTPMKVGPSIRSSLPPTVGGIPGRPKEPVEPKEQERVPSETPHSASPPQPLHKLLIAEAADPNQSPPQGTPRSAAAEPITAEEDPARPSPGLTDASPPIYSPNGPITLSEQPLPKEPVASPLESIAGGCGGSPPAVTQQDATSEGEKEEKIPVKNLDATKDVTADDELIKFGTGSTTGYSRETFSRFNDQGRLSKHDFAFQSSLTTGIRAATRRTTTMSSSFQIHSSSSSHKVVQVFSSTEVTHNTSL